MLTGELRPSFGDAYIQGHSLRKYMSKIYQMIGYCPQYDALIQVKQVQVI